MTATGSYSISHVNLEIECEDERLTKKVTGAIDNYFFLSNHGGSFPDFPQINLSFKNNALSTKVPQTAQELSVSPCLRVLKDGNFCYLDQFPNEFMA